MEDKFINTENNEIVKPHLNNPLKIITDEPTKDAPNFKRYSEQLSKLVVNSIPQFNIGIYGGWETGKPLLCK